MQITIVSIGKLKQKYWKEAAAEYIKWISPYYKIDCIELKQEKLLDNKEKVKDIETDRILNFLKKYNKEQVYLLDIKGKSIETQDIVNILNSNTNEIIFVIGGPLGLNRELLFSYKSISLSNLTFTHEITKIILLEQIYRAITIIKNKNYHY